MGRLGLLALLLVACGSNPELPVDARELDGPTNVDGALDSSGGRLSITVVGRGVVVVGSQVCATSCELDLSAPVTIAARAAEAWQFDGFSAPCGTAATCTPPLGSMLVATFSRAPITANLVFITSSAPQLSASGVVGLDAYCQSTAATAGLAGTYVAFVATSTSTITERLAGARGWVRLDGLPVLDQASDLNLNAGLPRGVLFDETGTALINTMFMTGLHANGSTVVDATCADWTATDVMTSEGGRSDSGSTYMYSMSVYDCVQRISCFGVDRNVPVDLHPQPYPYGRHVFVSAPFTIGGGLPAADAQCQADASAAGLPGTFRAALATTTASAATRIGSLAGTWRRPDGIVVTHQGLDQLPLLSAVNVDASGTAIRVAWTYVGALSWTEIGTSTCADWTSTAGETHILATDMASLFESPLWSGASCAPGYPYLRLLCAEI
jgi:hypothetical protein